MKKLLFILSAILVSAITYGASLNPYAYNLSSTWNEETQELTVRFTLNAHPNIKIDANGNGKGIQIYAVDSANPSDRYYIYGVPGDDIKAKMNEYNGGKGDSYDYTCVIPIDGMSKDGTVANRRPLPTGKALTWAVQVCGLNNKNQSKPVVVNEKINSNLRPRACHGVAVDRNFDSDFFGSIYVTEASPDANGENTWTWIKNGNHGNSLLEYNPQLTTVNSYKKASRFSPYNHGGLCEPHRVGVSDDGRVFVSSYNAHTDVAENVGKPLVWELDRKTKQYTQIIGFERGANYRGGRVMGMAVKGSGSDVKILLCFLRSLSSGTSNNSLDGWEYTITGQTVTKVEKKFSYTLFDVPTQAAIGNNYYFYTDGLASVKYGLNNDIYLGLDYFVNTGYLTRFIHISSNGTQTPNTLDSSEGYYGGGGIAVYKGEDTGKTMVAMARTKNVANSVYNTGVVHIYPMNGSSRGSSQYGELSANIDAIVSDFAIDNAYNLYAVSFLHGSENNHKNGTGRLVAIALPYGGTTTTIAPKGAAGTTFTLKPVPNILATDLTYAPYGNENKYEFSFNVNTKPELAQIRFYANEADMLANNGNYSFYYEFSEAERKQGRMSVIFDAVGGTIGDDKLLNDPNGNGLRNLPRGEYYWNVYVKTRESNVFAPIYTQPAVGSSDYHRQHATVDNNPNNKGFGHIYVADHHNIAESNNRVHYVRAYTIGNATGNAQEDNQSNINDNTRYTTHWQVQSNNKVRYTRRPVVSPDGMVYIADEGANQKTAQPTWFKDPNTSTYGFVGAGLHVLDPSKQTNNANAVWEANFSNPHGTTGNQEVTTGAYFLYKDGGWKLYRTNTYEEYTIHPAGDGTDYNYQNARWNNNGYRVYSITSTANGLVHSGYNDNTTTKGAFGAGDAGGQFSIVATEYGVWMCQHREKTVDGAPLVDGKPSLPDNKENIVLSFFDHSGVRRFTSYTYDSGNLTQKNTSILQSTPGAGMAYQKRGGVEYLYVVNHAGNIVEFKITGGATPTLTHTQTYATGNGTKGVKYGAISSMNFDYAGNLVVTIGATYGVNGTDVNGNAVVRDHQELVIYTMPYPNQENARAIPASEMYRYIPERVADDFRELDLLLDHRIAKDPECYVDIYRPMLTDMLNTICLPFDIDTKQLNATDYYDATLLKFSQAVVTNQNGEKILELLFTADDDGILEAGIPYLIQAKNPITGIVQLKQAVTFTKKEGTSVEQSFDDGNNSITYQGIIPTQSISVASDKPRPLILVDNNRLAEVQNSGNMRGFRAYFQLEKELAPGTKVGISARKPTPTNVITIDGKRVNVEKFLREGRVYIRVGDSLYTINGEKL